jgi:gamma-glutamylcyclotransferase (GGCT)/AIG2-like uncharacterized protein YtfP
MLYFAYGSNMYWQQMKERCPSARFVSIAKIKDHRVAFTRISKSRLCGAADIVPAPGREVWGVIYDINEGDLMALDKAEDYVPGGTENSYNRVQRYVLANGGIETLVWTYLAVHEPNPPLPGAHYKALIVEGARYWKLPPQYVEALEAIQVAE